MNVNIMVGDKKPIIVCEGGTECLYRESDTCHKHS